MNAKLDTPLERPLRKPLHLCLFTDSLEPSGLGEHMLTLAAEFADNYRILFVCPPSERGNALLARAQALGCISRPLQGSDADTYAALGQVLLAAGIDIFHCHAGIGWEGHQGIQTARQQQIPAIIRTEHLPYLLTDAGQAADYQNLIKQVDHFICVSVEAHTSYLTAGLPHEQLSVVRNGIRSQAITPDRLGVRHELGLTPTTRLIITVARMTEQKGHRFLLEAIPAIVQQQPDVAFLWVGDGPQEEPLRQQMQALGIDPAQVIFAGWRPDVPRLLSAADLFVLPSLFEGLPLVVLEAMSLDVPVIATDVCGTNEAIKDQVCGRLVPPQDSQALGEAILTALQQPDLTAKWVLNARWRFHNEFSAKRMASETAQIYETVLEQRQAKPPTGRTTPKQRWATNTRVAESAAPRLQPQSQPSSTKQERNRTRSQTWIASTSA